jgi:hypothetical protein
VPKFALLIYEDEVAGPKPPSPEWRALWEAYVALDEEATASGVLLDSQPFASASTATAVSVRGGGVVRRAGPTWSTARQLTGYYLVECEDESEAEVWALKKPAVSTGEVEIRRIMDGPAG